MPHTSHTTHSRWGSCCVILTLDTPLIAGGVAVVKVPHLTHNTPLILWPASWPAKHLIYTVNVSESTQLSYVGQLHCQKAIRSTP